MALIMFFSYRLPYAAAGILNPVSGVAPNRELLKDALPTELPRRKCESSIRLSLFFKLYVYLQITMLTIVYDLARRICSLLERKS